MSEIHVMSMGLVGRECVGLGGGGRLVTREELPTLQHRPFGQMKNRSTPGLNRFHYIMIKTIQDIRLAHELNTSKRTGREKPTCYHSKTTMSPGT